VNELTQELLAKSSEIQNLNGKIKLLENSLNKQAKTIHKITEKISENEKIKIEIINQKSKIEELERENYSIKNEIK